MVAVPPGVVTVRSPVLPPPRIAVIFVEEVAVNADAVVPPKLTSKTFEKLVPVIVIVVPAATAVGKNEVIVGAAKNVNPVFIAVPAEVVTLTLPLAPVSTTAVIVVGETTVGVNAAVPPKLTVIGAIKLVPVIVTIVPFPALTGVNEVIVGARTNEKPDFDAIPPGVVTLTLPLLPAPTVAVIPVEEVTVNELATVPPKLTVDAFVKLLPVMVIVAPIAALVGKKEVMEGALASEKAFEENKPRPCVAAIT